MNRHDLRSVETAREGDVYTPIEGKAELSELDSMHLDSHDEDID